MDTRSFIGLAVVFFLVSVESVAEAQLGRLVKEQQSQDNAVQQENKVEKKDVFAKAPQQSFEVSDFPYEAQCFQIDELILENDFLKKRGLNQIKEKIAGKCLGIKGIEKAAILVQDYYINAGFVTTRVETPSQDLATKKLILKIIPGLIEEVIVINDDVIKSLLPFGKGDVLNLRDIEQGLENIQRTPGVDVKIQILPGDQNGMSKVLIDPQRSSRWNIRTSYSNFGDESTGRQLLGMTGYLYNIARISDLFYLAGTSSQTGGYKNLSTYYSFPVGYTELSAYYSTSKSRQGIGLAGYVFDYIGKTEYLNLKGYRMLRRDADSKLAATAEIIRRKYNYTLADTELELQKRNMTNLRLGVNYKQNFTGATLDTTLTWQRFIPWLGGEKTPDMRYGDVSSRSQIVNFNASYVKSMPFLPVAAYYELNVGGQYSPDNLTLQDRLTIGDRWSVRGFENSGGIDGNRGFWLQNTLNMFTGFKDSVAYIGTDYGQIVSSDSTQDAGGKKMMGGVVGIKGDIKSLQYDFSMTSPFLYPKNLDVDKYTVNMNLSYQL
ncbi:ShlB/FhaC/HecB family hemolysin secretion/activation protein [Leclercia pneumoniae]|uniref:ShlB/FhaC/HecB family hemolysin secretion/activation protein n=1 Tax=Leclercia pneumoniae TaxID=2815358 RepID=UPI0030CEE189